MVAGRGRGRRRDLRGEETALWQEFIRAIKPLRRGSPADEASSEAEEFVAEAEQNPDGPASAAPAVALQGKPGTAPAVPPLAPLERRLRQRIARGTHSIDARLDLHGLTQARAHTALARFLRAAQADGAKLVLVITGKGRPGDAEGGVLRRHVPRWLAEPEFRNYVVGFEAAHSGHGGEGALYIRMRRRRP